MENKIKYDLVSDGLEEYYNGLIGNMTEQERQKIPRDMFFRVKRGRTSFAEKMAVLWKVFGKKCYIVITDNEEGMRGDELARNARELKNGNFGEEAVRNFISKGMFVLGDDSICRGFHYDMLLAASPMYKYLTNVKGVQSLELVSQKKAISEVTRMVLHYENKKKEMCRQLNVTLAEVFTLIYFSDGQEKKGSDIYLNLKFDAFGAGKSKVLSALKRLSRDGYLDKRGRTNTAVYKISTLGMDMYYTCLTKYILNY